MTCTKKQTKKILIYQAHGNNVNILNSQEKKKNQQLLSKNSNVSGETHVCHSCMTLRTGELLSFRELYFWL